MNAQSWGNRVLRLAAPVNVTFVLLLLGGCIRKHETLDYAWTSKVLVDATSRRDALLVSGVIKHSGSCVERVKQQTSDGTVTIVVTITPADGKCRGEFEAIVPRTPKLRVVRLGDPGKQGGTGVIWQRDDSVR